MTKNLATYIDDFAKKSPNSSAIVNPEGVSLSYQVLRDRSAAFAALLSKNNVNRLALLADRTLSAYIGVIATAWQGIAYVPLSLKAPVTRLSEQLIASKSTALLIDENGLKLLTDEFIENFPSLLFAGDEKTLHSLQTLGLNATLIPTIAAKEIASPKTLSGKEEAYIIFTSGSSGSPKGVLLSTKARATYTENINTRHHFSSEDRVAQPVDLSWDVSVGNYTVCFSNGATLYLLSAKTVFTPLRFIQENEITVWHSVPNVADILLERGLLKENTFPKLKWTDFSGAPLFPKTAKAWQKAAPNTRLVNSYGPTEMTVDCLDYELPPHFKGEIVPIGTVFPKTATLILKEDGKIAEKEEAGELLLSGAQQADGYLDDKEKTEAAFVWREDQGKMRRWYRTGDLVSQNEDGVFFFKGRIDHQLKVLGYRVETEEIETHLRKMLNLEQVIVSGYPFNESSVDDLICFFVLPPKAVKEKYTSEILFEILSKNLPIYMIPRYYYLLDSLPRLDNGKLNRKALPHYMTDDNEV
ncbi:D-alanine--poly(phosphoribitol) ligase [Acetobacteraceae bacterium]|nr:D-alanine--poly(phosphoribitol) ligase [Acetobacteraceae bacterium]